MDTTIYFPVEEVHRLIKHSRNATTRRSTVSQGYDEQLNQINNPEIPPGLILVKDEGIYLLSNGQIPVGQSPKSLGLLSYAIGFDPKRDVNVWERARRAMGGDDVAEAIGLEQFEPIAGKRSGYLAIRITRIHFFFSWSPECG